MVTGLDKFREYFAEYPDNYIIIGGTACDIIIEKAGLTPRVTKDMDVILVVEALSANFVKKFWQFIQDGNYERKEKGSEKRRYFRFMKPENPGFPYQIELFSRNPGLLSLEQQVHLTPIPVEGDLSSLSAILLDDVYYQYILEHSVLEEGLHRARKEALICMKAKAYMDISERITNGSKEDSKQLRKHKGDVFRLGVMLAENDVFTLPEIIKSELKLFIDGLSANLPGNEIFKDMGLNTVTAENVLNQISKCFKLYER